MLLIAGLLFVIALVLLVVAGRKQQAIGLPAGKIIYADTRRWAPAEQALYDAELGVVGKPDYLVEGGGDIIPVEVKSSQVSAAPYDSHIFQLGVYCLLVERKTRRRPPYGILHYPNRTFSVDFTPALSSAVMDLIEVIRTKERSRPLPRSHDSAARCNGCGYRRTCDEKLL